MIKNINNIRKIKITTLLILIFILIILGGLYKPTFAADEEFIIDTPPKITLDTSNKNYIKINIKYFCDDIGCIELETYKKYAPMIKEYKVNNTNKSKKMDNYVIFKKYDSKTNMASLVIKKEYFTKYGYNNNIFVIKVGAETVEDISISYDKGTWKANNPRINDFKYNNGVISMTISDDNGIENLYIKDFNSNKGGIVDSRGAQMESILTNIEKKNGKIVKGTYNLNIKECKMNEDGYYKLWICVGDKMEATSRIVIRLHKVKKEGIKKEELKDSFITNREVRMETDRTNKKQIKLNFKDYAGIEALKITTYTSNNKKIKEYKISGNQIKSNKKLDDYIKFEKYDSKTNMASLVIEKEYFTKESYNKDNEIIFIIKTKDKSKSALTSTEKFNIRYEKAGTWFVNRATRVNFIGNKNGYLYFTTTDYSGVARGKASLRITDKNNAEKIVVDEYEDSLGSKLTNVETISGKVVKGTYKLNAKKLKMDKDGYYRICIKATDGIGTTCVQNMTLRKRK